MTKIKRRLIHLFLFSIVSCYSTKAQDCASENIYPKNIGQPHVCLHIKGVLKGVKDSLNTVEVNIYKDGIKLESHSTQQNKLFSLSFLSEGYYSVEIIRKGYVPGLILVNTGLPMNELNIKVYTLNFEYEMISLKNKYNNYFTDYPAAIICFSDAHQTFTMSESYNNYILSSLRVKELK